MNGVHPEFAEHVRAWLVNPRRNVDRALAHLGDSDGPDAAREFLLTAWEQLSDLAKFVDEENQRHVHRCSCGHVHYVQSDDDT